MGCAIAHALAERGVTDVVVLERDQIGRGATADAAGGVRQQFSTETNIRLAQESVRVWETFPERFGRDIGLRQQGYLFLITDPAEEPVFRENIVLQQTLGVPSRWVGEGGTAFGSHDRPAAGSRGEKLPGASARGGRRAR